MELLLYKEWEVIMIFFSFIVIKAGVFLSLQSSATDQKIIHKIIYKQSRDTPTNVFPSRILCINLWSYALST